jgi:hypothetical protein
MFAFLRSRADAAAAIDAPLLEALADAHHAAAADADAALTPAGAAAQRAAILARLGATADPRVLSFPPREADTASRPGAGARHRAPRPALGWMLTAAAAGLVVGVGTGQRVSLEWPGRDPVAVRTEAHANAPAIGSSTAGLSSAPSPSSEADDAILGDVEVALAERGVEELQPLDALTPRVTLVASR